MKKKTKFHSRKIKKPIIHREEYENLLWNFRDVVEAFRGMQEAWITANSSLHRGFSQSELANAKLDSCLLRLKEIVDRGLLPNKVLNQKR